MEKFNRFVKYFGVTVSLISLVRFASIGQYDRATIFVITFYYFAYQLIPQKKADK